MFFQIFSLTHCYWHKKTQVSSHSFNLHNDTTGRKGAGTNILFVMIVRHCITIAGELAKTYHPACLNPKNCLLFRRIFDIFKIWNHYVYSQLITSLAASSFLRPARNNTHYFHKYLYFFPSAIESQGCDCIEHRFRDSAVESRCSAQAVTPSCAYH
jgi:hypothetical protein